MQVPVQFGHKRLNRSSLNGTEAIKMVDITILSAMQLMFALKKQKTVGMRFGKATCVYFRINSKGNPKE